MVSGLFGLFLRLYGFNRSLWLDELGHVGCRRAMGHCWSGFRPFTGRAIVFLLISLVLVNLLGESEIVLRGLSQLGVGTTYGSTCWAFPVEKKTALMAATFIGFHLLLYS